MKSKMAMGSMAAAIGVTLFGSLAGVPAIASEQNPFGMTDLSSGYTVAFGDRKQAEADAGAEAGVEAGEGGASVGVGAGADVKAGEGKCGEGKAKEGSCGEGKAHEGSCGEDKAGSAPK